MTKPVIGVMTFYINNRRQFGEQDYFRKLLIAGQQMGVNIYLFTPEDVDHQRRLVMGHYYNAKTKRWRRSWSPFPDVIFDRCRYQAHPRFAKLRKFRERYPELLFINRPLANKWRIYQWLEHNADLRPHLPKTELASRSTVISAFLRKHQLSYFKPINGTGGRAILRIEQLGQGLYRIEGRDRERNIITPQSLGRNELIQKLMRWSQGRNTFILQDGIDLKLDNGRVHDYRLLMQVNGEGKWVITGCAGRIGAAGSVTSNLHGGGQAVSMEGLMKSWFKDPEVSTKVKERMNKLAFNTVTQLQHKYEQLCELALDIAIDRHGHPWLLEINPKPSREVFSEIGERDTYRKAIRMPLEYAIWLHRNRSLRSSQAR